MAKLSYKYLNNINSPADLKQIASEELNNVCGELRNFIIDEVAKNPGHLGSNLGSIELTVALHYVFNTPFDRIVWDVGHQAYAHKIITGRRDVFHTNRKLGGISGFPKIAESEYDTFGVGHASTSISAALGMEIATRMKGEDRKTVAVIGDGSMTGGLAFEGLNNVSMVENDLLIVLNDNQMAIDPIQGGFTQYLVDITTSKTYNKIRHRIANIFKKSNLVDESRKNKIIRFNNSLKTALTQKEHNIFEGLNIRYFGPVDGHDVKNLIRILSEIKNYKGPKVLHVITQKGKGYEPAEKSVTVWHAPGKFDPNTGERIVFNNNATEPPLFQDVFGQTLLELAKENEKIVAVTPAMPSGCSMTIMQQTFPKRVFDVGIAEAHAVTFSAGLAKEGMIPFCNIYSSFMQRAYDSVIHDVALQNLPVIMCLDRAGIVGSDGATHQGQFDLAYMRCIPNLIIAAPRNEMELRNLMYTAQSDNKAPFVIRYPRGKGFNTDWHNEWKKQEIGIGECLKEGENGAIISIGTIANATEKGINIFENETGLTIAHYDARFLKPMDEKLLHFIGKKYATIITVEDGTIEGGFGSSVLEFMSEHKYTPEIIRLGIPDEFIEHGSPEELYAQIGLDGNGIYKSLKSAFEHKINATISDHKKIINSTNR